MYCKTKDNGLFYSLAKYVDWKDGCETTLLLTKLF